MAKQDGESTKKERVALRMTTELYDEIEAIRKEEGRTWSDMAHRLLRGAVDRKRKKEARRP